MLDTEIEAKVKKIIAEVLGIEESRIIDDASYEFDFDTDPLDLDVLKEEFEKEFNITISERELVSMRTVGLTVEHIEKAING
jgi:acyl carrier protein